MKSLYLTGLIAFLATTALHAQPTTGAAYWSTTVPDCSSLNENPVAITNASGVRVGYSCYVSGTFVWLAAGGGWSTAIRVAAPASGAVGVDLSFYDKSSNQQSMDLTGSYPGSTDDVTFALYANQPAEVTLVGSTANAPTYDVTATGSAYAIFYCPNAATCQAVQPQLLYSALPSTPWSLSVPITWDSGIWTQWSAVGIDDGGARRVSLVVYNESLNAATFTVRVFNSAGALVGTGTTPSIPPLQIPGDGQGGTYAALLSDIITSPLPSGPFKILVDGGSINSAVAMLQINGQSATTLQVAYDFAYSGSVNSANPIVNAAARQPNLQRLGAKAVTRPAFKALAQQDH